MADEIEDFSRTIRQTNVWRATKSNHTNEMKELVGATGTYFFVEARRESAPSIRPYPRKEKTQTQTHRDNNQKVCMERINHILIITVCLHFL